jgi:hypothetical protein
MENWQCCENDFWKEGKKSSASEKGNKSSEKDRERKEENEEKETDIQIDRQTDEQKDRQTDRQTELREVFIVKGERERAREKGKKLLERERIINICIQREKI